MAQEGIAALLILREVMLLHRVLEDKAAQAAVRPTKPEQAVLVLLLCALERAMFKEVGNGYYYSKRNSKCNTKLW